MLGQNGARCDSPWVEMGFIVEHCPIAYKIFRLSKRLSFLLGDQIKHGSELFPYSLALFVDEIVRLFMLLLEVRLSVDFSYH